MFGIVGYLINRFGHPPTKASSVLTNKHFNVGKMRKLRIKNRLEREGGEGGLSFQVVNSKEQRGKETIAILRDIKSRKSQKKQWTQNCI